MTGRFWAVVPAAGIGRRFGSSAPKQYSSLCGASLIERTLQQLVDSGVFCGITVAISPDDSYFETLAIARYPLIQTTLGGQTRAESVLAGLKSIDAANGGCGDTDWVMVHDAARPLVSTKDIVRLKQRLQSSGRATILGARVADTVKRVNASTEHADQSSQAIRETVDRTELWVAQTPQAASLNTLLAALESLDASGKLPLVTDEASALEMLGHPVDIIEGNRRNFKVTLPEDLVMAEAILSAPGETA